MLAFLTPEGPVWWEPGKSRRFWSPISLASWLAGADEDRTLSRPRGLRSDLIGPAIDPAMCPQGPIGKQKINGRSYEAQQAVRKRGARRESGGACVLPHRPRRRRHGQNGMVLSVTGPGADGGKYALAGAKIALDRVNKAGGVLGKQVELITEDDLTTNPGAVLAFSKLAAQPS